MLDNLGEGQLLHWIKIYLIIEIQKYSKYSYYLLLYYELYGVIVTALRECIFCHITRMIIITDVILGPKYSDHNKRLLILNSF